MASARPVMLRVGRSDPGCAEAALGLTAANPAELIRQLERGFSYKTLQAFESRSGLALSQLAAVIGIPERTLARRKVSAKIDSR